MPSKEQCIKEKTDLCYRCFLVGMAAWNSQKTVDRCGPKLATWGPNLEENMNRLLIGHSLGTSPWSPAPLDFLTPTLLTPSKSDLLGAPCRSTGCCSCWTQGFRCSALRCWHEVPHLGMKGTVVTGHDKIPFWTSSTVHDKIPSCSAFVFSCFSHACSSGVPDFQCWIWNDVLLPGINEFALSMLKVLFHWNLMKSSYTRKGVPKVSKDHSQQHLEFSVIAKGQQPQG